MLWLKSCPRCLRGDVVMDRDIYGWYYLCLQCGHTKDKGRAVAASALALRQRPARQLIARSV